MTRPVMMRGRKCSRQIALVIAALLLLPSAAAATAATAGTENFVWKAARGEGIPPDAFSAAPTGAEPVHVCRVRHNRDIEIGYIVNALCAIGGDGMSRPYSLFRTLIEAPGAAWARPAGALPANAIPLNDGFGPAVHACRVTHQGKTVVGMLRDGICSAGFDAGELRSDEYELLVFGEMDRK